MALLSRGLVLSNLLPAVRLAAEQSSINKRFIFPPSGRRPETEFVESPESATRDSAIRTYLATPLLRGRLSYRGYLDSAKRGPARSQKNRLLFLKPSLQAVIAIENVRFSKNSASATRNYARHWNIRPQRPKCSASSAAHLRMCSRCSTQSWRAQHGFVGIDDVVLRLCDGEC